VNVSNDSKEGSPPKIIKGWKCPACSAEFVKPGICPKHESNANGLVYRAQIYLKPMFDELPPE